MYNKIYEQYALNMFIKNVNLSNILKSRFGAFFILALQPLQNLIWFLGIANYMTDFIESMLLKEILIFFVKIQILFTYCGDSL